MRSEVSKRADTIPMIRPKKNMSLARIGQMSLVADSMINSGRVTPIDLGATMGQWGRIEYVRIITVRLKG